MYLATMPINSIWLAGLIQEKPYYKSEWMGLSIKRSQCVTCQTITKIFPGFHKVSLFAI